MKFDLFKYKKKYLALNHDEVILESEDTLMLPLFEPYKTEKNFDFKKKRKLFFKIHIKSIELKLLP